VGRPVPFLNLRPMHDEIAEAVLADVATLIETGAFTNGPAVAEFEQAFASYCGVEHCVGLASGLDALRLGLIAGGLEPGDCVIVPAQTFIATFEAVTQAGGVPVPVDISLSDYGIDPEQVVAAIDERTRFILPVHLYGQLADMTALMQVAASAGLRVLEDAAQAHGAERDGKRAGASGLVGAFSFYPGKNLGAMGDAGALVTEDEELAATVRALREHGQTAKYKHDYEGWTSRLDTIQALVLLRKLPLLDGWNNERRSLAQLYSERLSGIGDVVVPNTPDGSAPVWHLYVIRTRMRDELADFLRERGIRTGIHYPEPPHLVAPYRGLGYSRGSFPASEKLADEALSLPIFPGMSEEDVAAVVSTIEAFFRHG
jgi:dTDP-3-amino-3,4,6-trideoxy-alpha-D-glucose transaminase